MGVLEGIIYMLWRGLAIGFIISAPMGPVGILCVQRTLDKGRKTGLYTGIGAALSDILYCLLTGFGLSFIEEFLERNSNVIQLVGSVVLIGFGIYLFKSNPSRKLKKPTDNRIPAGKNILNGFLFTFSNPLIIFLIIGLFARFNFMLQELQFYHYILGFIAIFVGALLWWYIVTYFVDKVRAHFNLRSMWLINKIIGTIIFIFAVVGIVTAITGLASATRPVIYMNADRGFTGFRHATDSDLVIGNKTSHDISDLIKVKEGEWEWKFRVANRHNGQRKSYGYVNDRSESLKVLHPGWGIKLKGIKDDTSITFRTRDNTFEETYSAPEIEIKVTTGGKEISRKILRSGFDLFEGTNAYRMRLGQDNWRLEGGNREYMALAEGSLTEMIDSIGFEVSAGGEIEVSELSLDYYNEKDCIVTEKDVDQLRETLKRSHDKLEGEWGVFDMKLDDKFLKSGGNYRLAVKKDDDGYKIIYLSGAVTHGKDWHPGRNKGTIQPTPFEDIYDVEWIGATGEKISGIKAQLEGEIMTLQFPEDESDMRLRKITEKH